MSTPTPVERSVLTVHHFLIGYVPTNRLFLSLSAYVLQYGEAGFASLVTREVASLSDAAIANLVVRNVGITDLGVIDYVAGTLAAFGPAARGQVLINLAMKIATLESDPHFGAEAIRFNQTVAASYAVAIDPDNVQVYFPQAANAADARLEDHVESASLVGLGAEVLFEGSI